MLLQEMSCLVVKQLIYRELWNFISSSSLTQYMSETRLFRTFYHHPCMAVTLYRGELIDTSFCRAMDGIIGNALLTK